MRSNVDLPAPFKPSTPIFAPGKNDNEMSLRIVRLEDGITFDTLFIEKMNLSGRDIETFYLMSKIIFQYCRVSTTEQSTDGKGIDNQKMVNEKVISELMAQDSTLIRAEDIIETGSAFSGNNFSEVLEKFESGKIPKESIVVMFDKTRFSREDSLDAVYKLRDLARRGLRFYFSGERRLVDKNNISSFSDYIHHLMTSATANEESKNRRERTLASYNRKIQAGELVNMGAIPNWIRKIYEQGKIIGIEAIPERVKVIQQMFELYLEGKGATSIVRWLNKEVPVWTEHHDRVRANSSVNKLKDSWTESYVTRLLTDRRLIGERVFNEGRDNESLNENYYPLVIPKGKFFKAQEIRKLRSQSRTPSMGKYPPVIFMGIDLPLTM